MPTKTKKKTTFKLTYATMFNPPEELHARYDVELAKTKASLGREYGMIIDGKEVKATDKIEHRSPINQDWLLAVFQKGNATTPAPPWRRPDGRSPNGRTPRGANASSCCARPPI